jgi:hypothetical protein
MLAAFMIAATVQWAPVLPGWTQIPTTGSASEEYAFSRKEQDGTNSILDVSRKNCSCDPKIAATLLTERLQPVPGASVKRDERTMCGQPAEHLVVTGLAQAQSQRRNLEAFFFRIGPDMYVFDYSFTSAAPQADADTALNQLCPPANASAPAPSSSP